MIDDRDIQVRREQLADMRRESENYRLAGRPKRSFGKPNAGLLLALLAMIIGVFRN